MRDKGTYGNLTTYHLSYLNDKNDYKNSKIENQISILESHYRTRKYANCLRRGREFGNGWYNDGCFAEAYKAYDYAAKALEEFRRTIPSEQDRQKQSELNANLYARLVHCCLQVAKKTTAFEYAVASKGRTFVDMLASARLDLTNLPRGLQDKVGQADKLKPELDRLEARLELGTQGDRALSDADRQALKAELFDLRQQDNKLWQSIRRDYPDYFATQAASPLTLEEAQELASTLSATLVEFYRHAGGWVAFIIRPNDAFLEMVELPVTNDQLQEWRQQLDEQLKKRADNNLPWLPDLYDAIIAPLRQYLPPTNQQNPARLVLAPFSLLHLFPLAALHVSMKEGEARYLSDEYVVSVTPNLALLKRVASRAKRARSRLCAVAYPGKPKHYLFNVYHEVGAIASCFTERTLLRGRREATPKAVIDHAQDYNVVHYACHGTFEISDVDHSGLQLAGGQLRVRDIFNELRLPNAALAVLSACVTGQMERRAGDELAGLVQAFMYAGAPAVIASLWSVDDEASRYLFKYFYTHYTAGMGVAEALRLAQQELRSQGYEHPYYWAAFQPIGAVYDALPRAT